MSYVFEGLHNSHGAMCDEMIRWYLTDYLDYGTPLDEQTVVGTEFEVDDGKIEYDDFTGSLFFPHVHPDVHYSEHFDPSVWPDVEEDNVSHTAQQLIYRLRDLGCRFDFDMERLEAHLLS